MKMSPIAKLAGVSTATVARTLHSPDSFLDKRIRLAVRLITRAVGIILDAVRRETSGVQQYLPDRELIVRKSCAELKCIGCGCALANRFHKTIVIDRERRWELCRMLSGGTRIWEFPLGPVAIEGICRK